METAQFNSFRRRLAQRCSKRSPTERTVALWRATTGRRNAHFVFWTSTPFEKTNLRRRPTPRQIGTWDSTLIAGRPIVHQWRKAGQAATALSGARVRRVTNQVWRRFHDGATQTRLTMPEAPRQSRPHEQSFPLVSMVQLVTLCVAMVMCIDGAQFRKHASRAQTVEVAIVVSVAGGLGASVGAAIGLGQIRKWRGMFICGATGFLMGILMAATFTAPARPAQATAACLLPLVTTVILRVRAA